MSFSPFKDMVGGFNTNDGTIDFYLRVNSLLNAESVVLDLGAGRAGWFEDDTCQTRRSIRNIRGKVRKVIAADVDTAVLSNRASDEQLLMVENELKIAQSSVDIIIADYVLEHISDVKVFVGQVDHVLKAGGWLCARTPHKFSYVAIASRIIKNQSHAKVLRRIQPDRNEIDVFPAFYRLNTMRDIVRAFSGWKNHSFIYRADPAYYFGSRALFHLQSIVHRVLWIEFSGNLFIFMKKP